MCVLGPPGREAFQAYPDGALKLAFPLVMQLLSVCQPVTAVGTSLLPRQYMIHTALTMLRSEGKQQSAAAPSAAKGSSQHPTQRDTAMHLAAAAAPNVKACPLS